MILRAAWVAPVVSPPIRDGFVRVEADRITAVGAARDLPPGADTLDLGHCVLTPGLVNPHTHLELSCYAGRLPPGPFWEWLPGLVALRREPGQIERESAAAARGAWESLRAGVTCVGDISRRNVAWRALRSIPIRKVCFVELLSLADDPPRNAEELEAAATEVIEDALLTVGVSPHTPYSTTGEHFRAAIDLARRLDRPWTTHLAETPEELAFLSGQEDALPSPLRAAQRQCGVVCPRQSPAEFLAQRAAGAPPGALAHLNYLASEREMEALAAGGHTVLYCPRAHHFFGHGPHPWLRLLRRGVRVAIGTDSPASNWGVSMLDELRHLRAHVRGAPAADALWRMATLDAAVALRLADAIGSLEAGKQADLAAFPCGSRESTPLEALICEPRAPSTVWTRGKTVIRF